MSEENFATSAGLIVLLAVKQFKRPHSIFRKTPDRRKVAEQTPRTKTCVRSAFFATTPSVLNPTVALVEPQHYWFYLRDEREAI